MADMDGYPTVSTESDGVYLTVYPPKGKGKAVDFETIKKELDREGVKNVDMDIVFRAVKEATGQAILIVEEKTIQRDGIVTVNISPDEMMANITILPPQGNGKEITMEAAMEMIKMNGVVFGIREEKIQVLVSRALKAKDDPTIFLETIEDVIAEGQAVKNGENSKLEILFEQQTEAQAIAAAHATEEAEKVDFKNVKSIINVKKGQALAKKLPFTEGVPGITVNGKEIAAEPGQDIKFVLGRGVEVAIGQPDLYLAANDGQVIYKENKLQVLEIYEIPGDVDMSIGNINFVGTVIIHGNVGEFKIVAGEDVLIDGVADGTDIKAGGRVMVKGGIIGKKAHVVCNGEITCKYIRNAYVESETNIIVNEAAMHSTLIAGQKIVVLGAKGLIVGGTTVAGQEVNAKTIGSNLATPTEIEVGETPRMREEKLKVETDSKLFADQMDKTKKGIIFLKDMSAKMGGQLPPDKRDMLAKLTRTQFKLMTDLKKTEESKHKIEQMSKDMQTTKRGKISCMGIVFTGLKININKAGRTITDEIKYSSFVEKNGETQVLTYSG